MSEIRLTKYEKVRAIGIRAQQLAKGAPACVDITGMTDSLDIAEKEFAEHKIPLIIKRNYPDGTVRSIPMSKMSY